MSPSRPSGPLDGVTLFRFAHVCRDGNSGGVEAYLSALNKQLLLRNRMRILQTYLAPEQGHACAEPEVETLGCGELIWIPSTFRAPTLREYGLLRLAWHKLTSRREERQSVNNARALSVLETNQPSLAVFHWLSEDAAAVADHLRASGVPVAVVHHFSNRKLNESSFSKQLTKIQGLGVVSRVELPQSVKDRACHLSDGIDTEFFDPARADGCRVRLDDAPVVLLPSRIYRGKGHLDAVRVLAGLRSTGITARLVFAGRVEDKAFNVELRAAVEAMNLQTHVSFVGDLQPAGLRDWYAACDLTVLPSSSEGLPRIVLEAQAMQKPVVAYDVGGTGEALINGLGGYLTRAGDVVAFGQHVRELLTDRPQRLAMGMRGRQWVVNQFSLSALVARHEAFYAETLKSAPRGHGAAAAQAA